MYTRFFSAATLADARAVPELVPPNSMVRPWVSIHSRALEAAMSALFWWSAVSSSMGMPIELLTADHQNKADIAASKAREWIDTQGLTMLFGGTNSGTALASAKVA